MSSEKKPAGYRNPPEKYRFRKGRSGNPRGRRLGDRNLIAVFKQLVSKTIKVRDGDRIMSMTMADAVLLQNYRASLQKDQSAMNNIMRLCERAGEFTDMMDPKQVGSPIVVPERSKTIEEFMARFGRPLTDEERALLKEGGHQ